MPSPTRTLSDAVIEFLEAQGVQHVFTVSGGGSIFLCDALARAKTMKYICCHHEQAAGYAAEAYARLRGLGVTLVTSGPGGTNAVSSCAASWTEKVPHIFISGQVFFEQTRWGRGAVRQVGVQEINILDIIRGITKYRIQVRKPRSIQTYLNRALKYATTPPCGPVWIDIPADVQNAHI